MHVPEDQLRDIYRKYVNNQCTPEELAQLVAALGEDLSPAAEEQVARLMDETWEQLQTTPGQYPLPGTPVVPMRPAAVRRWWKPVAAAAVLLLAAALYFLRPSPSLPAGQPLAEAAIAPGQQGALLTLEDGRVVALDSAGNGVIAVQGSAELAIDSGKLTYNTRPGAQAAPAMNVLHTPRGRTFRVILPDGTAVWLNAASTLRYPVAFTGEERAVELSGEAYFEVAKAERPFRVKAGALAVDVLGTHFNVNSYADEERAVATLMEGRVKVNNNLLTPGQQFVQEGGKGRVIPAADTEEAISWKNGYFRFKDENIQRVMRKIERWYDVEVAFRGEVTREEFSGTISRDRSITEVLELLESTKTVHFKTEGRKIIVSR
ncbi:FecR domain-containing protein [Chitinophaga sp.]|uniref:FecR family protein n=1 Tax=Chitinophaga sp. TaxID=1869181 RepID=UPI0031E2D3AA